MQDLPERIWVALTNSYGFRRFAKQDPGAKFFRSQAYHQLAMVKRHVTSYYPLHHDPARFNDVRSVCIFIGHNKSGNSMLGALLDAHPNIILADEAGAVRDITAGFSREQIFYQLLRVSRREAMKGRVTARRLSPYSFEVPGQWQGSYTTLRVIGDSTAGTSTQRFAREPDLLQRLHQVMDGLETRFIQMIRNPYDPISYMMVRGQRSFANAIDHYFANCTTLTSMRRSLDNTHLLPLRYEEFIAQPVPHLTRVCHFLGVDAEREYLQACGAILRPVPDRHRQMVDWTDKWIGIVQEQIDQYDFLAGYSFDG